MSNQRRARWRALALIAAAALFAGLIPSLFYVWGHTQIVSLGYRIAAARLELRRLEDEGRALRLERARLTDLRRIEPRARRLGFAPAPPGRTIIVQARTME